MERALRVLCLDIEGGYGGSSRSLYESIRHLPAGVKVEVWCRREGPIQNRYRALGVPCAVMPEMPNVRALPLLSRNLYALAEFVLRWRRSRNFRTQLADAVANRFDVVHFNHEGLFWLAKWLRKALGTRAKLTGHVRTPLPRNCFSRWQYRILERATDSLVFITEIERDNFKAITNQNATGMVIYNIVAPPANLAPLADLASDRRFKVASLSNFSWMRGSDRLVDVAAALKRRGRHDVLFVVAGSIALTGSLRGVLGRISHRGGTLADYASERGVGEMFRFLGHVADPMPVLAGSDMLARPSRAAEPWGREVLEAMGLGLPVVATGWFDRFVEPGVTGFLQAEFDAEAMADIILDLADDRSRCARLGARARARVEELCHGPSRARDLADLWWGLTVGT